MELPDDLKAMLDSEPEVKWLFEALPPSHQREYVKWIEEARKPETRAARLEKMRAMLLEKGGS